MRKQLKQQEQMTKKVPTLWKTAVDKSSQQQYYYNKRTKETVWEKPQELIDAETKGAGGGGTGFGGGTGAGLLGEQGEVDSEKKASTALTQIRAKKAAAESKQSLKLAAAADKTASVEEGDAVAAAPALASALFAPPRSAEAGIRKQNASTVGVGVRSGGAAAPDGPFVPTTDEMLII
jgi:hypothetical protein